MWVAGAHSVLRFEAVAYATIIHNHVAASFEAHQGRPVPVFLADHNNPEWPLVADEIVVAADMVKLRFIELTGMRRFALAGRVADESTGRGDIGVEVPTESGGSTRSLGSVSL
jgi:hypothetical protein